MKKISPKKGRRKTGTKMIDPSETQLAMGSKSFANMDGSMIDLSKAELVRKSETAKEDVYWVTFQQETRELQRAITQLSHRALEGDNFAFNALIQESARAAQAACNALEARPDLIDKIPPLWRVAIVLTASETGAEREAKLKSVTKAFKVHTINGQTKKAGGNSLWHRFVKLHLASIRTEAGKRRDTRFPGYEITPNEIDDAIKKDGWKVAARLLPEVVDKVLWWKVLEAKWRDLYPHKKGWWFVHPSVKNKWVEVEPKKVRHREVQPTTERYKNIWEGRIRKGVQNEFFRQCKNASK